MPTRLKRNKTIILNENPLRNERVFCFDMGLLLPLKRDRNDRLKRGLLRCTRNDDLTVNCKQ
jgi:hypothetical protein